MQRIDLPSRLIPSKKASSYFLINKITRDAQDYDEENQGDKIPIPARSFFRSLEDKKENDKKNHGDNTDNYIQLTCFHTHIMVPEHIVICPMN